MIAFLSVQLNPIGFHENLISHLESQQEEKEGAEEKKNASACKITGHYELES